MRDLAKMIQDQTGCEVNYLNNPRNEDAENELVVSNNKFINFLGDMIRLESQEGLFDEVQTITSTYKHRCIKEKILPASFWNKRTAAACADNTLEVMKANVGCILLLLLLFAPSSSRPLSLLALLSSRSALPTTSGSSFLFSPLPWLLSPVLTFLCILVDTFGLAGPQGRKEVGRSFHVKLSSFLLVRRSFANEMFSS